MVIISDVLEFLKSAAPLEMKMDFDNVGLLVGRAGDVLSKVIVSLDITSDVVTEALDTGAQLVVSHHPLFFSINSVTDADVTGRKIVRMLSGGVSAICMHTNLDAARGGVGDALAVAAGIASSGNPAGLLADEGRLETGEAFSYGRVGHLASPLPLKEYMASLKAALGVGVIRYYDSGRAAHKVAVVSGSGGSHFEHAAAQGCDTFVTPDLKNDYFLEAKERGINLIDADHFCTENVVVAPLASKLQAAFPGVDVRVSEKHSQTVNFY